jgi:archaellum component FlaC
MIEQTLEAFVAAREHVLPFQQEYAQNLAQFTARRLEHMQARARNTTTKEDKQKQRGQAVENRKSALVNGNLKEVKRCEKAISEIDADLGKLDAEDKDHTDVIDGIDLRLPGMMHQVDKANKALEKLDCAVNWYFPTYLPLRDLIPAVREKGLLFANTININAFLPEQLFRLASTPQQIIDNPERLIFEPLTTERN